MQLLTSKLQSNDEKFTELLEMMRNAPSPVGGVGGGNRKKKTPPSSSSSSLTLLRRGQSSDEEDDDEGYGKQTKTKRAARKSRAHRSPAELCRDLKTGGEGVPKRKWDKVMTFVMTLEDTTRLVFAHLIKFPSQVEVEEWWCNSVIDAAGLHGLAATDPAYKDIRTWAAGITQSVLT